MPPTNRDAAEAMREPRAGDRWEKETRKLIYFRKVLRMVEFGEKWDEMLYADIHGQICATTPRAFRRWCAGATYLGGAS